MSRPHRPALSLGGLSLGIGPRVPAASALSADWSSASVTRFAAPLAAVETPWPTWAQIPAGPTRSSGSVARGRHRTRVGVHDLSCVRGHMAARRNAPGARCEPSLFPSHSRSGGSLLVDVILVSVRWYMRYDLLYRDVEELLAERGMVSRRGAGQVRGRLARAAGHTMIA